MSQVKQYDYIENSQKKLINLNNLLSFSLLGFIFSKLSITLKSLFIYQPVFNYMFIGSISLFIAGILLSRAIFLLKIKSRIIYLAIEIFFNIFILLFLIKILYSSSSFDSIIRIFFISPVLLITLLSIIPFVLGIKTNYFLKISSGLFFDEKQNLLLFYITIILGFISGLLLNNFIPLYPLLNQSVIFIIPIIITCAFFIKLDYKPNPIFAKKLDDTQIKETIEPKAKQLYSSYLTIISILIYLYLGFNIINNFNDVALRLYYIICISCAFLIGVSASHIFKKTTIKIISEIFLPLLFLLSFILIKMEYTSNIYFILAFFTPGAFFSGFVFLNIIQLISSQNEQKKIYNTLLLSTIILPGIFIFIIFPFSPGQTFLTIIFQIALLFNICTVILFFYQKKDSFYKKSIIIAPAIAYFTFSILTHYWLSPYQIFESKKSIYKNLFKKISPNDFTIENINSLQIKRAISIISLYRNPHDKFLFINGYNNFPVKILFDNFPNNDYLEYVPEKYFTENNSGLQSYKINAMKFDLLFFLQMKNQKYSIIADIPNKNDQKNYNYRFSFNYYTKTKEFLKNRKIFIQILNISALSSQTRNNLIKSFNRAFLNSYAFLFNESLILVGSDTESITLNNKKLESLQDFLKQDLFSNIFFNEKQSLAYILYTSNKGNINQNSNLQLSLKNLTFEKLYTEFSDQNNLSINILTSQDKYLKKNISEFLIENQKILSEFKKAELAAREHHYEKELEHLFNLKAIAHNKYRLNNYIANILSLKEKYYLKKASNFEQRKKWEKALQIYLLLLKINKNNFEANYKIGRLLITLQNLEPAFNYLQTALKLKKDNPEVLYQLGVLLFTNGKFKDSLEYLQKALTFKKDDASIYFYMGLCHEELENLNQAKYYYKLAIEKEPENQQIIFSDKRVNEIIDKKRNQWKIPKRSSQIEEEKDEHIDLPINKNAIDKRLKDDENSEDL